MKYKIIKTKRDLLNAIKEYSSIEDTTGEISKEICKTCMEKFDFLKCFGEKGEDAHCVDCSMYLIKM